MFLPPFVWNLWGKEASFSFLFSLGISHLMNNPLWIACILHLHYSINVAVSCDGLNGISFDIRHFYHSFGVLSATRCKHNNTHMLTPTEFLNNNNNNYKNIFTLDFKHVYHVIVPKKQNAYSSKGVKIKKCIHDKSNPLMEKRKERCTYTKLRHLYGVHWEPQPSARSR